MIKRRLTKQKKVLYDILKKLDTHLTSEQVYVEAIRQLPNLSLATVYRNLELMRAEGLLDEVYVAGRPKWYEIKKYTNHGHLFCEKCSSLEDVVECSFCMTGNKIQKECGFQGREISFLIIGLCQKCNQKKQ
ncbi:MAG TPA: transcriptional repressor [bacterium]|nr:transcriptional repressor [bacterium]